MKIRLLAMAVLLLLCGCGAQKIEKAERGSSFRFLHFRGFLHFRALSAQNRRFCLCFSRPRQMLTWA